MIHYTDVSAAVDVFCGVYCPQVDNWAYLIQRISGNEYLACDDYIQQLQ